MRRSRKLTMWSALPPYLGGKRRLCPLIFREVDRLLPRREWATRTFLDGFLGGGSVSLYAKAQGFRVVSTDIAERSIVTGKSLIANNRTKLTYEDILRVTQPSDAPPGRIEREYAPRTFTSAQGRLLDRLLEVAGETADEAKGALCRLLAVRVALLIHPMSQVRAGTIHRITTGEFENVTESCVPRYIEGLRITRPSKLWEIAQQINLGVFEGRATVRRVSVLDALPEIEADVAYCYRVTREGIRHAVFLSRAYARLLRPGCSPVSRTRTAALPCTMHSVRSTPLSSECGRQPDSKLDSNGKKVSFQGI